MPSDLSAGNKARRYGVSKLASLNADMRVEGGVEPNLIGKCSSVGGCFCDNDVTRTWRTQQPSESQEGQMQSRTEDRVTTHLAGLTGCREHVGFMRTRNN